MFFRVITQALLDSASTFLIYNYLLNKDIDKNNKNILYILLTTFIYIIARVDTTPADDVNQSQIYFNYLNYDLFPVNSFIGILFLVLAFMILNSYLFKSKDDETIYLTLLSIVIFISFRIVIIYSLENTVLIDLNVYEYIYRIVMLMLLYLILCIFKLPIYKIKNYIVASKYILKIIVLNSFILIISLVSWYKFNLDTLIDNIVLILIIILIILVVNFIAIMAQRENLVKKKRIETIETYFPVIDGLIDEVRSKQHEFDNKILAIYSIIETSDDIDEIKNKINLYRDSVSIDNGIKKVIIIDNKIIAGFIYSKLKLAKIRNIRLEVNILASLKKLPIEEYLVIEILGVLIDNAIEASLYEDIIYLEIDKKKNSLDILVKNAYKYTLHSEFERMFELGYSTKSKKLRGYGLYNVINIMNDCNGNILFSNEEINNTNYITIGVSIPFLEKD